MGKEADLVGGRAAAVSQLEYLPIPPAILSTQLGVTRVDLDLGKGRVRFGSGEGEQWDALR